MEVNLGPGDFTLDGDPAPAPQTDTATNFWPMSVVPKRLDRSRCHLVGTQTSAQVTLCYMGTQLPQRGTVLNFRPMSVVAKLLDGSRMSLDTEVGLVPCHSVRWGSSSH